VITTDELVVHFNMLLDTARFKDYCPNGLQVEGRRQIGRIVSGVSANAALIDAAIEAGADAIVVHHGYFWRNEPAPITGSKKARIARLLAHDINLFAFHLPLDAHPVVGNNVQLGQRLGLPVHGRFGDSQLAVFCDVESALPLQALLLRIEKQLARPPQVYGAVDPQRSVGRIGWCTGAAQGYFDDAVRAGCDVYMSGEVSEQNLHAAIESGVPYVALGHHASERYGVQALCADAAEKFGLEHRFIDIANPV
jgi:dinuclear metal center YbgI/SA1388 family protein